MKNTIQKFLQLNHGQNFSTDYLHRYLDFPIADVNRICDELIAEGAATRPEYTHYVAGVEVDWAAVHAGEAGWPTWANGFNRLQLILARLSESTEPHVRQLR